MAEVQNSSNAGENAARFIEFVMMQAQNASLFLGLIPNPGSGEPEVNLDLARMFIDQLAMIGEKTRGNLSSEEAQVLRNALTNLQMAYVEVAKGQGSTGRAAQAAMPVTGQAEEPKPESTPAAPSDSSESKKRFTKNYGS